jgi:hypothetical protein
MGFWFPFMVSITLSFIIGLYTIPLKTLSQTSDVRRQVWPPLSPLESEPAPIVLYDTPAKLWPALKKWNLEYFRTHSAHMPMWEMKMQSESPEFVYSSERPLLNNPQFHFTSSSTTQKKNVTAAEYISLLAERELRLISSSTPNQGMHFYWTDGIGALRGLADDLLDLSFLSLGTSSQPCDTGIWVAGSHIVTHTHYDSYYNMFVMVTGRKRFQLAPPEAWPQMNLYPALHPRFRQSQSQFWPNVLHNVTTYEVVLNPGEVLYLPPFWFHRVTSLEPSVAVNCWCYSEAADLFYEVISK